MENIKENKNPTLNFFGCGGAFDDSINSSAYINDKGKLLIIDCGENTFQTIKKYIDKHIVTRIDIVITHLHSDHVGGLSTLIHYLGYVKGIKPTIFGGDYIIKHIEKLLNISGNNNWHYDTRTLGHISESLSPKHNCKVWDNLNLYCFETTHVSEIPSYSIILEYKNKNILFSGDSKNIVTKELNKYCIMYFDEIYHECYFGDFNEYIPHTHYTELEEYAREIDIPIYHYHNNADYNSVKLYSIQTILNNKLNIDTQ